MQVIQGTAKTTELLPQPDGVVAGGTATFRIPTGKRIHELILAYNYNATTQNVADFTEIRIFANNRVIQRFDGTKRDVLNQHDGLAASTGVLHIPFDRYGLDTVGGREQTALNTGKNTRGKNGVAIETMYMEIDLDSGMTIAAGDLSLYARQSDAIPGAGPGIIPFIDVQQRSSSGANTDFQIGDLVNPGVNAPDKLALSRVTFVPSTGSIADMKVRRNGYTIFDRTDAVNRSMLNNGNGGKAAQAGYYMIDTGENGVAGEVIDLLGLTDYRYHLDVSAAMTVECVSEYLGVLSN